MTRLVTRASEDSTMRSYHKVWDNLKKFGRNTLKISVKLPVSQKNLGMYVTHLFNIGLKPNTVQSHVSAISYFHKINGLSDPSHSFFISKLLRGIQKEVPTSDSRMPISKTLLMQLVTVLPDCTSTTYERIMLTAMFLSAYFLCLRVGEIAKSSNVSNMITLQQVSSVTVRGIIVAYLFQFTEYKHHKGHKPILRLETQSKGKFCPVKCLTQYLAVRTNAPGPLFLTKSAKPITRLQFWTVLKKCLSKLGRDAANFGTHSFRIGRCTDMVRDGYSDEKIKKIGRWKSTAFRAYNRPEVVCA